MSARAVFGGAAKLVTGDALGGLAAVLAVGVALRALGAEQYGALALAISFGTIVATVLSLDTWVGVVRSDAAYRVLSPGRLRAALGACLSLDLASATLASVVGLLVLGLASSILNWSNDVVALARVSVVLVPWTQAGTAQGWYRARGRFALLAIVRSSAGVLRLGAFGLLAFTGYISPMAFLLGQLTIEVLGATITTLLFLRDARRERLFPRMGLGPIRAEGNLVRFMLINSLGSTLSLPSSQFDVFIASRIGGLEAVGVYRAARQFVELLTKVGMSVYLSLVPDLAREVRENGLRAGVSLSKRIAGLLLLAGIVGSGMFVVVVRFALPYLFDATGAQMIGLAVGLSLQKALWLSLVPLQALTVAASAAVANVLAIATGQAVYLATALASSSLLGAYALVVGLVCQSGVTAGVRWIFIRSTLIGLKVESRRQGSGD